MNLKIAVHSDEGIKKKTNQDSILVKVAHTERGPAALFAVCDGMGGLAKGELASAALVRSLDRWFMRDFPILLYQNAGAGQLKESICACLEMENQAIASYGRANHVELGTTAVALFIVQDMYYVVNVGDSRAYLLSDRLWQITKDQTFVQRELDAGRMTAAQAMSDSRRNMLLQCIGASRMVAPDFYEGKVVSGTEFLLCSDGFRHMLSEEEIYGTLHSGPERLEREMEEQLFFLTETVKERQETDNISSILVRID